MSPAYKTQQAAAADVAASEATTIEPSQFKLVSTGYSLDDYDCEYVSAFILIARSSLALKKGLMLGNGVGLIDTDYRGEIKVMLFNATDKPVAVRKGERVAQLLALRDISIYRPYGWNIENEIRQGGFGSTGGMKKGEAA